MSVIGLEKTLATELAPDVRANVVLLAPHETVRMKKLIDQSIDRGEHDCYEEGVGDSANNLLVRIADPMELGNTVTFLSSPVSEYINGQSIVLDGGGGGSNH